MKAHALLLLTLPLVSSAAPPAFLPSFQERLDLLPNLSLGETIKQGTLPRSFLPEVRDVVIRREPTVAPRSPRYVSRMPVIEPNSEVDRHMPIKTPDPTKDYKITIKEPNVVSVP